MPIRFRCPNCDQLLGISRRKAGASVRCPSCQHEAAVPAEDEVPPQPHMSVPPPIASVAPPPVSPALFERDDFDDLLNRSVGPGTIDPPRQSSSSVRTSATAAPRAAAAWGPVLEAAPAGGVVLSPGRATLLTVVIILMLALAFAAGLLVGRYAF